MKIFRRKPKHEHTWGKWYPSPTYHSFDERRCTGCGMRQERYIG